MKLTKYDHACIVLEEQGKKLVIDPGVFTPAFGDLNNVAALVVTHEHPDHFNPKHLEAIIASNPEVQIFTTPEVAAAFAKPNVTAVTDGQTAQVDGFSLLFGGEKHAVIYPDWPYPQNTTVMVNDTFYYPGDSYVMPVKPVSCLAVPANAPWMKIAESVDYIGAVKPKVCIPTHNGLLSEAGKTVYYYGLGNACEQAGAEFRKLESGESLDI